MYRKDVPKFNKYEDYLGMWDNKIKLLLSGLAKSMDEYLTREYVEWTSTLYETHKRGKLIHKTMMIELASALKIPKYVDIHNLPITNKTWDELLKVYSSDKHILEEKLEGLKEKLDSMRMHDHDIIYQYGTWVKEIIAAIKGACEIIEGNTVVSKMLRTLPNRYAIRVCTIQELRIIDKRNMSIDSLIGRLTTFKLSNCENSQLTSEVSFQDSINNGQHKKEKSINNDEYEGLEL